MRTRVIGLVLISFGSLGLVGTRSSVKPPVMPGECVGTCEYCEENEEWHQLALSTQPKKIFDQTVPCSQHVPGSCNFYPACGNNFATRPVLENLWYAVARNDRREVEALVKAHPDRIVFVPERSAIQVLDCNADNVVGQIDVRRMAADLSQL